jgi:4-amino-4-deoxy-L-arabinose transferase-like glycosyltransferase
MPDGLKKRKELLVILSLISLGAIVRIIFINKEGLWFDETLTALALRMPFYDMIRERLSAGHSPLYFAIIYPMAKVFGTGEIAVRAPSCLVSILGIYIFHLIAKRLFSNDRIAVTATIFFILSALNVYFAQEARMYSFSVLFVLLSYYFLLRALDENRSKLWIFYTLSTAVLVNLSASAIPILFAQAGFVLIKRERILQFILSLLAIIVLYIPMGFLYIRRQELDFIEWLTPVSMKTVFEIFYGFGFRPLPSISETWIPRMVVASLEYLSIYFVGALIVWGIAGCFLRFSKREDKTQKGKDAAILLLLWFFLPLIIEYGYSIIKQPLIGPKRYVIILSPAYYLLLGLGLQNLRWKKLKTALIAALLTLFSFGLYSFYISPKREDWRGAIAFVDKKFEHGEVMFGTISSQTLYKYYGKNSDMVIMDIRYLNARGFAKGWILLRDLDYRQYAGVLEDLNEVRSLIFIDDYQGIKLYHFER